MKINGWLNIDKPVGVTSNQVIGYVKRVLRSSFSQSPNPKALIPKIGFAGTLDPMASGVLPIAIGEATKAIPYMIDAKKTYEFTIKFGIETDSGDVDGKIIATTNNLPSLEDVKNILPEFTGKIRQTPPIFSAIKIDGKRAYDLARKGIDFEMKEREVNIWELGIEGAVEKNNQPSTINHQQLKIITLKCTCSKGTYIRSLGRDIAKKLGSLGHLTYLRRLEVGCFSAEKAFKLEIEKGVQNINLQNQFEYIISQTKPVDSVLDDIPVLNLRLEEVKNLRDGKIINSNYSNGIFRVYFEGVFQCLVNSDEGKLKVVRFFNL
ncbi:MAG: tRNA pseudouridine(55) synthase TruB [Rickettsiales bacterium]|nr:tRNA pseudouridine(55) synthase TruB [Rickettsiales bacterium]